MPLVSVRLEWVRSAEPPSVIGIASLMTPSAISEDLRVATLRRFGDRPRLVVGHPAAKSCGNRAGVARDERVALGVARASPPRLREPRERAPAARQAARHSSGISNGG